MSRLRCARACTRSQAEPDWEIVEHMVEEHDTPIYLTAIGRRRLEQRLEADRAEVARRSSPDAGQPEEGDTGDAAVQLAEADDRDLVRGLIERTRDILAGALPVPEGPDDGVVRLGS